MQETDFNEIISGLYQGSVPPRGQILKELGFDILVLCSREFQFPIAEYPNAFPGLHVIRCPFDDSNKPDKRTFDLVEMVSDEIKVHHNQGKKILVTCQAGLNRSGLVNALALHKILGYNGKKCIEHIRSKRGTNPGSIIEHNQFQALHNKAFVEYLMRIK